MQLNTDLKLKCCLLQLQHENRGLRWKIGKTLLSAASSDRADVTRDLDTAGRRHAVVHRTAEHALSERGTV